MEANGRTEANTLMSPLRAIFPILGKKRKCISKDSRMKENCKSADIAAELHTEL